MSENNCVLKLEHLVFDECSFVRDGFKNENELMIKFGFQYENQSEENFVVRVAVEGQKEKEYRFVVRASGYFKCSTDTPNRDIIVKNNATAIVFPYVRSQITLLTAQPEVDPVALPPFNIAKMVEDSVGKQGESIQ